MVGVFTVLMLVYAIFNFTFSIRIINSLKDMSDKDNSEENKSVVGCLSVLYVFALFGSLFIYLIYLGFAFTFDPLVYPTAVMLVLFFVNIFRAYIIQNKQKKLKDEYKNKKAKRTIFGLFYGLTMIVYLIYMLYALFLMN